VDELQQKMELCEKRIGYVFQDKAMLRAALTHASGAEHRLASNERLEFLGDSILGLVVCERLYHEYPTFLEGDLTKIKSVVVSRATCTRLSKALGLDECLIVGKGIESGGELPDSLLSDVLESLVAAMRIDGGMDVTYQFIAEHFFPEIEAAVAGELEGNFKSYLQQFAQREFGAPPVYHLVAEHGPDHSKQFKLLAEVGGKRFTAAWGANKKQAEQRAAENALAEMKGKKPPHSDDRPL